MFSHAPQRLFRGSRHVAFALIAAASLAASACDDDPTRATRPTTFVGTASSVSFGAQSTTVFAQPVSNFFCPGVAPFSVPMVVLVNPGGAVDFAVTNFQLQFTDTRGRQMPQVTLPAPVPVTQFGDALNRSMKFPLSLGIGCGVGRTGNVVVIVQTRDRSGRHREGRLTFDVR